MKHNENFEGTKQLKNHETGEKLVLKKIWNRINRSIKYRLFFYLIVISVIPLVMMQIFNMMSSRSVMGDMAAASAEAEVKNTLSNMDRILENIQAVCNSIEYSSAFQGRMRATYPTLAERFSQELEGNMDLVSIVRPQNDIYGLYVLGNNKLCCKSVTDSFIRMDYCDDSWYKEIAEGGLAKWYSLHDESFVVRTAGKKFITYSVPYVDKATASNKGVIVVDIEEKAITSVVESGIIQNGFFFLLDENQEVFYHTNGESSTEDLLAEATGIVQGELKNGRINQSAPKTIRGKHSMVVYQQSSTANWTLVGVIPQKYFTDSLKNLIYMMMLMLIVIAIVAVAIASFLAKRFTNPIINMKQGMKLVEKGDLTVTIQPDGTDELAELSGSFNHMVMKIRKLVDSIYEKQELLRKSEFKALQAQINPHFLYNSLDSIIWLLRMERTDEAIVILQNLIVLFRIFLSKGHEVIPVRQEVRHLDSYLQIQSMRYSRKFTYTVDVPEEYKDFYTLKLILQPLVENSIYHGMSAEHGSIHIHISLIMGKDTLTFRVEDTGQGMSEEQLERLRESIQVQAKKEEDVLTSSEKEGGYGLQNVNERIKIYFGAQYGLSIESKQGEGTTVNVVIPKIQEYES